MEGCIDYFTGTRETLPDYFDAGNTLFFLDEPNRLLESGDAVEQEFRESMEHRAGEGLCAAGA